MIYDWLAVDQLQLMRHPKHLLFLPTHKLYRDAEMELIELEVEHVLPITMLQTEQHLLEENHDPFSTIQYIQYIYIFPNSNAKQTLQNILCKNCHYLMLKGNVSPA